ncbi:hypothetical protein [Streptomyces sp. SID13726]|uniref:hypothetical protein n=1 Tax=Streptomyces sp. SID13726 TaxID=2706058 RepID=UPI0013BC4756|nr:hypothetical protein [Streptomyces sp. SID13726]NEB02483.1 hypothetical protein [Streptomyces sp. SID13726]
MGRQGGEMQVRMVRGGRVSMAVASAVALAASCTVDGRSREVQAFEDALQPLHQAKSFRMTGEFHSSGGAKVRFEAALDGRRGCAGTVGGAESVLVGKQVWTRWADSALPEAVSRLAGDSEVAVVDPAADLTQDPQWAATELLRGAYMVTTLPGDVPETEGIAPVCQTGLLLAGAATAVGDVTSGPVTVRDGQRLRSLSKTKGPVTIRVYVPAQGSPKAVLAEYQVEGGRSFSMQFKDVGKPVTVHLPEGEQTVTSGDVMTILHQDGA